MTVIERERLDRRFKAMSKVSKWVRHNISKTIGGAMLDKVYDMWSESYNR